MLKVIITINKDIIENHYAINQVKRNYKGETLYLINDKYKIWHRRSDGAKKLAIKILKKVKNKKK